MHTYLEFPVLDLGEHFGVIAPQVKGVEAEITCASTKQMVQ